jgi:hypothetical protein
VVAHHVIGGLAEQFSDVSHLPQQTEDELPRATLGRVGPAGCVEHSQKPSSNLQCQVGSYVFSWSRWKLPTTTATPPRRWL